MYLYYITIICHLLKTQMYINATLVYTSSKICQICSKNKRNINKAMIYEKFISSIYILNKKYEKIKLWFILPSIFYLI